MHRNLHIALDSTHLEAAASGKGAEKTAGLVSAVTG